MKVYYRLSAIRPTYVRMYNDYVIIKEYCACNQVVASSNKGSRKCAKSSSSSSFLVMVLYIHMYNLFPYIHMYIIYTYSMYIHT